MSKKTSLLCAIVGHRWNNKKRRLATQEELDPYGLYHIPGWSYYKMTDNIMYKYCLRCGEKNPEWNDEKA